MPIPTPGVSLVTTIANGAQVSSVVDLSGGRVVAIGWPAAMTGIACTFEAGTDPNVLTTFKGIVKEDGSAYSITVTADKITALDNSVMVLAGPRFIRLKSGSAEAASRTIHIFVK